MPQIDLKPRVIKFIRTLPPKHKKQVKDCILALGNDPLPHDARPLVGYYPYIRVDVGEYRVIYRHDEAEDLLTIVIVGKRNGDEVYRVAKRIL